MFFTTTHRKKYILHCLSVYTYIHKFVGMYINQLKIYKIIKIKNAIKNKYDVDRIKFQISNKILK